MSKIKPSSWSISYFKPSFEGDDEYTATIEYEEKGEKHEVSQWFKRYSQAYAWLNDKVEL